MANKILADAGTYTAFTITLANLGAAAVRQTTMLGNSAENPMALCYAKFQLGGDPGASDGVINIYLLRGNDASSPTYRTDGAGASDALMSGASALRNATPVATLWVPSTMTTDDYVYKDFVVGGLDDPLGAQWGLAVENKIGGSVSFKNDTTHILGYTYTTPEIQ